jgi:hypothetical protein
MRTSFQPEAQHPNFQLSTSWQADYPIFWRTSDIDHLATRSSPPLLTDFVEDWTRFENGDRLAIMTQYLGWQAP